MSTDSFSTHSLYIQKKRQPFQNCNSTILCATNTIQAMNRLNEKNPWTAPESPNIGEINDITASTQEKTKSDTEQFRKFSGTYHKSAAADPVLHSTLPTKYTLYTHY